MRRSLGDSLSQIGSFEREPAVLKKPTIPLLEETPTKTENSSRRSNGMNFAKSVEPGPVKGIERCRAPMKAHRAYIAVFAVLTVAAVVAISIVLTQHSAEVIYTQGNSTTVSTQSQSSLSSEPESKPLFLLTGDSITAQAIDPANGGWVTLLLNKFSRAVNIIPCGLSGYNSRWFLKYAVPVIEEEISSRTYTPTLITVWFGSNDAALPYGSKAVKHVPVETYADNLVQIVRRFQAIAPTADILLVTPPHVDDDVRLQHAAELSGPHKGLLDRSNSMAGKYARVCVETGDRIGIPVLDLYTYFNAMPATTRNALLSDGLHFNAKGHKIVSEQLRKTLEREFPGVAKTLNSLRIPPSGKWEAEDPWVADSANGTRA